MKKPKSATSKKATTKKATTKKKASTRKTATRSTSNKKTPAKKASPRSASTGKATVSKPAAAKKAGKRPAPKSRASVKPPRPVLRLAEIVRKAGEKEGGYAPLSRAIGDAYGSKARAKGVPRDRNIPDRRKLRSIADQENVTLSIEELFALDAYLTTKGLSLAHTPLLEKPAMIRVLAESEKVVYLVGAKSMAVEPHRAYISDFDLVAISTVMQPVSRLEGPPMDVRHVHLPSTPAKARASVEESCGELFADDGPSLVCIGSPRANASCEYMLSEMFGVEPWKDERVPVLPFHFVWPTKPGETVLPSVLHLAPGGLKGPASPVHAVRALVPKASRAMITGTKAIMAEPPQWDFARDLGVICCQRRKGGQLWVCAAGLSGPATVAAAMAIDQVADAVPSHTTGQNSDVMWVMVEAGLRQDALLSGQAIKSVMSVSVPGKAQYVKLD